MVTTVDGIPVGGSTGADTYGRNRYGSYIRRRTVPVNPNSIRQSTNRSYFRAAVNNWSDVLTDSQRLAWTTWAGSTPWLNRAGQSTFMSGQAAYVRQATFLYGTRGTDSEPDAAPAIPLIGALSITGGTMVYDISTPGWALEFTAVVISNAWQDADPDSFVSIDMSEPMGVGRTFRPNRWRRLAVLQADTPATVSPTLPVAVGDLPFSLSILGGQRVWFRFRGYSATTRQVSENQIIGPILTSTQA